MRHGWLLASILASGCALYRLPPPQVPMGPGSTDWSAVRALPHGHFVFVTLDGGDVRRGLIWSVTDTAVTLYEHGGERTHSRTAVVLVAERVAIGTEPPAWYVGVPSAIAFWGGLTGLIVGGAQHNKAVKIVSWLSIVFGLHGGMAGEYRKPILEDRLVYVRR